MLRPPCCRAPTTLRARPRWPPCPCGSSMARKMRSRPTPPRWRPCRPCARPADPPLHPGRRGWPRHQRGRRPGRGLCLAAEPATGRSARPADINPVVASPGMSGPTMEAGRPAHPQPAALERPVIDHFEAQVRLAPDRLAVQFEGASLSYAELNRRANRLARELIAQGVQADEFVGVCMQRSLELVVALLGIVKAGAAYVPFDPDYPPDRLAFMMSDSGAQRVLTHAAVRDVAFPAGVRPVWVDSATFSTTTAEDGLAPAFRGGPNTAVYMIYTSGSTGQPKGVPNLHRGLANRVL